MGGRLIPPQWFGLLNSGQWAYLVDKKGGLSKMVVCWFLRSVQSCPSACNRTTNVQWQATIEGMSTDFINDETDGSLVFELGNWSASTGSGAVNEDYVGDGGVWTATTWGATVDFWDFLQSFSNSQRLMNLDVLCEVFDKCNSNCEQVKIVAWPASSWPLAFLFAIGFEHMLCPDNPRSLSILPKHVYTPREIEEECLIRNYWSRCSIKFTFSRA